MKEEVSSLSETEIYDHNNICNEYEKDRVIRFK